MCGVARGGIFEVSESTDTFPDLSKTSLEVKLGISKSQRNFNKFPEVIFFPAKACLPTCRPFQVCSLGAFGEECNTNSGASFQHTSY